MCKGWSLLPGRHPHSLATVFFFFRRASAKKRIPGDRSPQISILSLGPLYFAEAARILGC